MDRRVPLLEIAVTLEFVLLEEHVERFEKRVVFEDLPGLRDRYGTHHARRGDRRPAVESLAWAVRARDRPMRLQISCYIANLANDTPIKGLPWPRRQSIPSKTPPQR